MQTTTPNSESLTQAHSNQKGRVKTEEKCYLNSFLAFHASPELHRRRKPAENRPFKWLAEIQKQEKER